MFAQSLLLAACSDNTSPIEEVTYVVQVQNETFKIRAAGNVIAALEGRRQSGVTGVISGRLVRGNGGFNSPYGWHMDPATIEVPDVATEVCDGRPSDIDPDLNYWIDTVKVYCPWGARVISVQN